MIRSPYKSNFRNLAHTFRVQIDESSFQEQMNSLPTSVRPCLKPYQLIPTWGQTLKCLLKWWTFFSRILCSWNFVIFMIRLFFCIIYCGATIYPRNCVRRPIWLLVFLPQPIHFSHIMRNTGRTDIYCVIWTKIDPDHLSLASLYKKTSASNIVMH